jgi:redox-sensitive bicupin YhaK (pirin superfamily)
MTGSSGEHPKPLEPAIEITVLPRLRDLGEGFEIRRVLPASGKRMVGPFVFFDHFGPTILRAGRGLDVRPHPHIGLATVTYLYEGQVLHRDSLGSVQLIRPGEVNWMTAGRGIAHSERTPPEMRVSDSTIFGVQLWVGLPKPSEEAAPSFEHRDAQSLPLLEGEGLRLRVIAGSFGRARAPVATLSATLCVDAELAAGSRLALPPEHEERAAYITAGEIEAGGERFTPGRLLVFAPGRQIELHAPAASRLLLLGGETMDAPRHLWWNFVSSSRERIEQAKEDWKSGRFGAVIGETEFIPLPEAAASSSFEQPPKH